MPESLTPAELERIHSEWRHNPAVMRLVAALREAWAAKEKMDDEVFALEDQLDEAKDCTERDDDACGECQRCLRERWEYELKRRSDAEAEAARLREQNTRMQASVWRDALAVIEQLRRELAELKGGEK